jgi:hypothetical protein
VGLGVAPRNDGPISSASTSVTVRRPLGGLPVAGLEPAEDDHAVILGQGVADVLGQAAPEVDPEEGGVAVLPALPVPDAGGDGDAEVGDGGTESVPETQL